MDAIDLLVRHHRDLEELWGEARKAEGDERATRFARAADELAVHVTTEEKVFYPAVQAARTEEVLMESLEEHLSLKRLLADLLALPVDDAHFTPKLDVLIEQLEHHHREEEDDLFPNVKKLLDAKQRESLGRDMAKLMAALIARDAPRESVKDELERAASLD